MFQKSKKKLANLVDCLYVVYMFYYYDFFFFCYSWKSMVNSEIADLSEYVGSWLEPRYILVMLVIEKYVNFKD